MTLPHPTNAPTPAEAEDPVFYPVVLRIISRGERWIGKERTELLSRLAREALRISAEKSGVLLERLLKDKDGAPIPLNEFCWSLTHKPKLVAGVIGRGLIGIDIEEIIPRSRALFARVADRQEWDLSPSRCWKTFFRYWTAKEATLKANGTGLSELKRCRIARILDEHHLLVDFRERLWHVEQMFYENHIISIAAPHSRPKVRWILSES
jgi:4'-phosphopantetheinyl transferase